MMNKMGLSAAVAALAFVAADVRPASAQLVIGGGFYSSPSYYAQPGYYRAYSPGVYSGGYGGSGFGYPGVYSGYSSYPRYSNYGGYSNGGYRSGYNSGFGGRSFGGGYGGWRR